jgi:phosphohistidine phosphatase
MKRLTLLRHAKSSWDDSSLADHDRPLSARGQTDAPRIGRHLAQSGIKPDLALISSARRAQQTAALIAPCLTGSALELRTEPRLYLATPGELLQILAEQSDDYDELLVVGHNPGLTQLVNMMLPALGLTNLPTAGAVRIDCDTPRWSAITAGRFALRSSCSPKTLPS